MPGDFIRVAGNDLTLFDEELGRCMYVVDSGIGGGGGKFLKLYTSESLDFGREAVFGRVDD
jgi:hypothetical protein